VVGYRGGEHGTVTKKTVLVVLTTIFRNLSSVPLSVFDAVVSEASDYFVTEPDFFPMK
jgi:hypothetical protein